mmetsp:Transcript_16382/g.46541  ORF Transcript_16382/g.46541 Transcript_16382/m.46541 type:complete len:293 (-) Transcript_16382:378-1256(-)
MTASVCCARGSVENDSSLTLLITRMSVSRSLVRNTARLSLSSSCSRAPASCRSRSSRLRSASSRASCSRAMAALRLVSLTWASEFFCVSKVHMVSSSRSTLSARSGLRSSWLASATGLPSPSATLTMASATGVARWRWSRMAENSLVHSRFSARSASRSDSTASKASRSLVSRSRRLMLTSFSSPATLALRSSRSSSATSARSIRSRFCAAARSRASSPDRDSTAAPWRSDSLARARSRFSASARRSMPSRAAIRSSCILRCGDAEAWSRASLSASSARASCSDFSLTRRSR